MVVLGHAYSKPLLELSPGENVSRKVELDDATSLNYLMRSGTTRIARQAQ